MVTSSKRVGTEFFNKFFLMENPGKYGAKQLGKKCRQQTRWDRWEQFFIPRWEMLAHHFSAKKLLLGISWTDIPAFLVRLIQPAMQQRLNDIVRSKIYINWSENKCQGNKVNFWEYTQRVNSSSQTILFSKSLLFLKLILY